VLSSCSGARSSTRSRLNREVLRHAEVLAKAGTLVSDWRRSACGIIQEPPAGQLYAEPYPVDFKGAGAHLAERPLKIRGKACALTMQSAEQPISEVKLADLAAGELARSGAGRHRNRRARAGHYESDARGLAEALKNNAVNLPAGRNSCVVAVTWLMADRWGNILAARGPRSRRNACLLITDRVFFTSFVPGGA